MVGGVGALFVFGLGLADVFLVFVFVPLLLALVDIFLILISTRHSTSKSSQIHIHLVFRNGRRIWGGERDRDAPGRGPEDHPRRFVRVIGVRGLRVDGHGDAAGGGGQGEGVVQGPPAPDGVGASVEDCVSFGRGGGRVVFIFIFVFVFGRAGEVFCAPLWIEVTLVWDRHTDGDHKM